MTTKFAFGKNWQRFLECLTPDRIRYAEASLDDAVGNITGKTFVDVGCGSGLASLAAAKLRAGRILSFDSDHDAVHCVTNLQKHYRLEDRRWGIWWGNILNQSDLSFFGTFDVVYCWGVLHHTGNMEYAMGNITHLVAPKGLLFVSIYNDQGGPSKRWRKIKQLYNASWLGRWSMLALVFLYLESRHALRRLVRGQNPLPFKEWRQKQTNRGMSVWHDLVDWVGGLPFEVAKPEEIIHFYQDRGFRLKRLKTCAGSYGCNEFLFSREA